MRHTSRHWAGWVMMILPLVLIVLVLIVLHTVWVHDLSHINLMEER